MGLLHIRRVLVARELRLRLEALILSIDDEPIPSILQAREIVAGAHLTAEQAMAEQWSQAFPSLCCQACRELQSCSEFLRRAGPAALQEGLISAVAHQLPNGRMWAQWIGPVTVCQRYHLPGDSQRDRDALRLLGVDDELDAKLESRIRAAGAAWAKEMSAQSSRKSKAKSRAVRSRAALEEAVIAWFGASTRPPKSPPPIIYVDPPIEPEIPHAIIGAFVTLQVSPTRSRSEVRRAYTRRMLEVHPDHGGNTEETMAVVAANRAINDFLDSIGEPKDS